MNANKKDNKGFSLVELIIVIAIMAVLVGVLAPAYLRYVEKSRKSADVQAIDAVMRAMEMAAIDPGLNVEDGTVMKARLLNTSVTTTTNFICINPNEDTTTNIIDELFETIGSYQLKSQEWAEIIIQGTVSGGQVTFKIKESAPDGKKVLNYASDLNITSDDSISFQ